MHKSHTLATAWTDVSTVDVASPVAHVSATVVEEAWLALEHLVAATVAEMVCRTIVWIGIEARLEAIRRTVDGAIDVARVRRDEDRRVRDARGQRSRRRCRGCWRGCANRLVRPHATLVRFGVPQTGAALQHLYYRLSIVQTENKKLKTTPIAYIIGNEFKQISDFYF